MPDDKALCQLLDDIAALMAKVEHRLYVEAYVKKLSLKSLKPKFCEDYGITARYFNGVSALLAGKVHSALESKKLQAKSLEERIASAKSWLKKTDKKVASLTKKIAAEQKRLHPRSKRSKPADGKAMAEMTRERQRLMAQAHHKKRYMARLEHKLSVVSRDIEQNNPRFCFGSRRLLAERAHLAENGYSSPSQWRKDWDAKRANQFFCIGSHDENTGNVTLTKLPNGKMRLGVPPALAAKWGHWVTFDAPRFSYGQEDVDWALVDDAPVDYRFLHRANGLWYLQVIVGVEPAPIGTVAWSGAVGVDLNADHVALGEVDRFGNPVLARSLPVALYKRSKEQVEACLGDVVAEVVGTAKLLGKPVVAERLDFSAKRARLREVGGHRYARMLSGFAYKKFFGLLEARCAKEGVELIGVNPAWTSLVGLVKFAGGYGLTVHQAAAVAIARRGMGPRHKVCKCEDKSACDHALVPRGLKERLATKARNAPPLPERNRGRHVWSDWNRYQRRLREDFSLGRRPSEGCSGGALAPSSGAPASRRRARPPLGHQELT